MTPILTSTCDIITRNFLEGRLDFGSIATLQSVQLILMDGYDTGVMFNRIEPIGDLPEQTRQEYWDEGKRLRPDLDPYSDEMVTLCKTLYYLTILATKYDK